MLDMGFFRRRNFSGAISSIGLAMFALLGGVFVLTQFLQFELGYTALQAGIRTLPMAGAIIVIAPLSVMMVRVAGTKLTVAAGLLVIAGGLWQISTATVTSTYLDALAGIIMIGVGAGLVMPSATASVMGSIPQAHLGVGSATNSASIQIGSAFGVAIVGSLLSTRYQYNMAIALASYQPPNSLQTTILGSLGAAQAVAAHIGGTVGAQLVHLARPAFMSGMSLSLTAGAAVATAASLLALAVLPREASRHRAVRFPGR